jgi:TolB-like protein
MKNLFTAFILAIALAGVSLAQAPSKGAAGKAGKPRIAVIEFTPGPDASTMTVEAKRHLQASIAFSLFETRRFDVVDVRNTRFATQASLAAINGSSTAAAVKAGKQLGVSYVLTGTVVEYDTKGGQVTLKTRLIEVATGKVKYSGETTQQSTSAMTARAGEAEMMSKVLKPAIKDLTARLTGV